MATCATCKDTARWLRDNGYPALPVAPAQDPYKYPKVVGSKGQENGGSYCPVDKNFKPVPLYTGKNPSYLDAQGVPHLVNHRTFQDRLPATKELKKWFANPSNGVGTLGGWNDTVWLDFDVKQFESQEECDRAVLQLLENPQLQGTLVEKSHSGGWRIGVKVKNKPTFTNFALAPGGVHVGEALHEGRFTVLAPTIGPSGNSYQAINRTVPVEVENLESIGIYPVSSSKPKSTSTPKPVTGYVPGAIPLEQLGNDFSRDILAGNSLKGDRSDDLTTAVQEWYGWANWANENGITITGTPEDLAHYAGDKLGIDSARVDRILKTIDSNKCHPAAQHQGGDESCWKKIRRLDKATYDRACPPELKKILGKGTGDKVVDFPVDKKGSVHVSKEDEPEALEWVIKEIDILIEQGVKGSQLTGKLNRLAAQAQIYIKEVRKLYEERLGEADLEVSREDNRTEVKNLLALEKESIDLNDYLPPDLAEPLSTWGEWLSIRPEVILTALLAGCSSLHKVGTELVLHRNQNFRVPPTIFAALVSESGQRKSPIFNNLIRHPLGILSQEKEDAYRAAMEDYEKALEEWEKAENKGEKPKPPPEPTLYYFTNATGEAIPMQASKAPQKALMGLIDELAGLFKAQDSYRGGRGSDKQDLLSYFDGSGQTVLRASGIKVNVRNIYLSVFGTIQPAVLKTLMDCSDPDGQWARFLFVNQPLEAATLSDDDGQAVSIGDRVADFYRRIDRLPEMEYRLSRAAFKRYQPLYNRLERLRTSHPKPGMRAIYSKMEGYIGRLALNLHVLWELALGKEVPDEEISLAIMEMAIALAKFYIGQVKLVHSSSEEDELAPHIVKLIELSKRLEKNGFSPWVKSKQYIDTFPKKKRPTAQLAREWMQEAVALGYGSVKNSGNRLEYNWRNLIGSTPPDSSTEGDKAKLGTFDESSPSSESIENKELEAVVGLIRQDTPLSNSSTQEEPELIQKTPTLEEDVEPELTEELPEGAIETAPSPNAQNEEPVSDISHGEPCPKSSESSENAQVIEAGDRVRITEGSFAGQEGKVFIAYESVIEVKLVRSIESFYPHEVELVEKLTLQPGDRVFVDSMPHTDKLGPFAIEEFVAPNKAKLELFDKPVVIADLRSV